MFIKENVISEGKIPDQPPIVMLANVDLWI